MDNTIQDKGVNFNALNLEQLKQLTGETGDVSKLAGVVSALLSGNAVTVTAAPTANSAYKPGAKVELDKPVITVKVDIARLVAILKLDTDETQSKELKKQIDLKKGQIEKRNTDRMAKIDETLKQMDKARNASIWQKITGWAMTVFAVAVAVGMCVATGGVALGPLVGAGLAIGFQLMNTIPVNKDGQTVTEKIIEDMAVSIQNTFGCDKATAQMWSSIIWTACQIIASIACGKFADMGAGALANKGFEAFVTAKTAFQAFSSTAKIVVGTGTAVMTLGGLGISGHSIAVNKGSGDANADLTEFEAILKALQNALKTSEDELAEILKALMSGPDAVIKMLESADEASKLIAMKTGQMA